MTANLSQSPEAQPVVPSGLLACSSQASGLLKNPLLEILLASSVRDAMVPLSGLPAPACLPASPEAASSTGTNLAPLMPGRSVAAAKTSSINFSGGVPWERALEKDASISAALASPLETSPFEPSAFRLEPVNDLPP